MTSCGIFPSGDFRSVSQRHKTTSGGAELSERLLLTDGRISYGIGLDLTVGQKLFTKLQRTDENNECYRSHLHDVYTEEVNKVALSAKDDKRVIMENGLQTLAYVHYRLKN